jgi:hypothetical protein
MGDRTPDKGYRTRVLPEDNTRESWALMGNKNLENDFSALCSNWTEHNPLLLESFVKAPRIIAQVQRNCATKSRNHQNIIQKISPYLYGHKNDCIHL